MERDEFLTKIAPRRLPDAPIVCIPGAIFRRGSVMWGAVATSSPAWPRKWMPSAARRGSSTATNWREKNYCGLSGDTMFVALSTWEHPLLERLQIAKLLAERGITQVDYSSLAAEPPDVQRQRMLAADLGITSVGRAIAETGTLALESGPGHERVASLLPPVHVAIVERSQILPDLFDLFDQLESQPEGLPSNLVLITGPSKTGDLELKLTTGVHGPGNWHVIVIDR